MGKVRIGYDDNLGLASDFPSKINCDVFPQHNLTNLINDFDNKKLDAIFIPAGTLPYVKNYKIISQSLFGQNYSETLETIFVTTKSIAIIDIPKHSIGRVNKFCTTSYWAPQISLMKFLPKNTKLQFTGTNGFKDLLLKTAAAEIDCCMIWDIFLKQNPDAAEKVKTLFSMGDLPTPIIIAHDTFSPEVIEKINQFKTTDETAFFTGFKTVNTEAVDNFQLAMQKAIEFYNINLND